MKLCIVTATRAEYGVLKLLISKIQNSPDCDLCLIVTGTHLSDDYGNTVNEIENDGFPISQKVYIELKTSTPSEISKTMGHYFISFADVYEKEKPDFLIVVGDRYELIPICFAAVNAHIPIAHISGGEVTEGAIDDVVRHCITKMSYLHFPGCEIYRQRIIQLGENPNRVFNFGDIGIENIKKMFYISKDVLEKELRFSLQKPYFSVTFHPVTQEDCSCSQQIAELLSAIDKLPEYNFIITKANSDLGGMEINNQIDMFAKTHDNCIALMSLGITRYLSLLKYSSGIIGNSSSGIIEAPCFGIPTINIGERQKGRLQSESILNVPPLCDAILSAIHLSQTSKFRQIAQNATNPYGDGETSSKILETIKDNLLNNKVDLTKSFYDIVGGPLKYEEYSNHSCSQWIKGTSQ